MKYCQKCGKEIMDDAVVCPGCGCAVESKKARDEQSSAAPSTPEAQEKRGLAVAAVVCAFLVPIAGIAFGIIGAAKYKTSKLKKQCISAIVISVIVWIGSFLIMYL